VVDEVRIAGQVPAIEHLVLVAHIHSEVLVNGFDRFRLRDLCR